MLCVCVCVCVERGGEGSRMSARKREVSGFTAWYTSALGHWVHGKKKQNKKTKKKKTGNGIPEKTVVSRQAAFNLASCQVTAHSQLLKQLPTLSGPGIKTEFLTLKPSKSSS